MSGGAARSNPVSSVIWPRLGSAALVGTMLAAEAGRLYRILRNRELHSKRFSGRGRHRKSSPF
jgi:hypothetical protein